MPPTSSADFERAILDAARAGVAEHGYANLSMRQIAKAVGCSVGTIYLYYANKDALYGALVDEAVRHLIASYQPAFGIENPVERLEAFCRSYVRFAMTYPEQYKVMYLELNLDPGRLSGYGRAMKPLLDTSQALKEAHEQGLLHSPSPMGDATFVWAALHGTLSLILARLINPNADHERLIDLTIRRVIDSFRCPPRETTG